MTVKTIEIETENNLIKLKSELYNNISRKIKIYLDLNYFIDFIKIENNIKVNRTYIAELNELLMHLISANKAIILISDSHIYEACKKKTDLNYKKLISKMNLISNGICLSDYRSIDLSEILFCLRLLFHISDAEKHLMNSVYTRPFFILHQLLPDMSNISKISNRSKSELQCDFLNYAWGKSLNDIFLDAKSVLRDSLRIEEFEERIKNNLTNNRTKYAHEFKNFMDLYKIEVFRTIDLYKSIFEIHINQYFSTYQKGTNEIAEAFYNMDKKERILRIMFLVVESIFGSNQYNVLPSIMIGCGLHTIKRYNQQSHYANGDYFDIMHAKRALPYSDYFITEKTLRGQINDNRLSLGNKFKCKVMHKAKEAYDELSNFI